MKKIQSVSRRHMLGLLGSGGLALAAGFDPIGRRWVTHAEAGQCPSFIDAPRLHGTLLLDAASREADSRDKGNIVHRTPCAVLRPGSVQDIQKMIVYCRRFDLKVATRGQAHTTFGQALSPGLVIENGSLNRIHSIGPDGADVDAGVRWKDLILAAYDEGLTPPVITGYTNLSIGGTLSVGGISGRNYAGAQVDHVRELDVVTGNGEFQRCSMNRHRDLFEVVLAGLGQCAVITRVKTDLVRVKPMVRLYSPVYFDTATLFRDVRTLIRRGELNEVYNIWAPGPAPTGFVGVLQAAAYFDPSNPPNNPRLMRGLSMPAETVPFQDIPYLDWILSVDNLVDSWRATRGWDDVIKPWFDAWLPESTIEGYVTEVLPTLTPSDVGTMGFILLFPLHRSKFTRPFFRLPQRDGGEFVYLFDILTARDVPGPDPAFVEEMLNRNRRLFERARNLGGTRYPIGSVRFSVGDWIRQYGTLWDDFVERKLRYDPRNLLSPGSGIFRHFH
jgi:cytokinin dehydrogenase